MSLSPPMAKNKLRSTGKYNLSLPIQGTTIPNLGISVQDQDTKDTPQIETKVPAKRKGPGRPKKSEVAKKTPGNRKQVGRPKGDSAIINEYKARMLASPKSKKVIEAVFDAALTDGHPNQSAAWKLVMDRIAPVSSFEADIKRTGGNSGVTINIQGIGEANGVKGVTIDGSQDAEDAEVIDTEVDQ